MCLYYKYLGGKCQGVFNLLNGIFNFPEDGSLIQAARLFTWANRSQILFIRSEEADVTVSGFLSSSINRINLGMSL